MKPARRAGGSRIALFLAVVGPGFITANVDNDAGGIWTYSVAGAQFGYSLLWAMIPIDHRAGRRAGDGGADGRGHRQGAERSHPRGVRLPRDVLPDAGARRHEFRQRRWPSSPASRAASSCSASRTTSSCRSRRLIVWVLVVQGTYSSVEKIFLSASAFYVCYIVAGRAGAARLEGRRARDGDAAARASASATTATSTWSSAWSARRSRRGCSSTCRRRSSRRA